MKLGLSSYTYGWAVGVRGDGLLQPLDEHGLLDRCRDYGLKLLQIGDNLPLHSFDGSRLTRLADRALSDGVQLEVGARRLTAERVAAYAVIARRVGARLIRFVIDDVDYHPTPEAVTEVLRDAVPTLDGLTLGLENHDRFAVRTLRQVVESVSSDCVGICLDTANSLGAGEGLETVLRELAPFTVNLHLKDFIIKRVPYLMGFTVEGRPAGEGTLDIPKLLGEFAPCRRCGTATLELWTPPETQLADTLVKEASWADRSVGYLRPMFD